MKPIKTLLPLLLILLLAAACSTPTPTPARQPTAPAFARSGTIRFSQGGNAGVRDIPSLLAYDALREMGYTVEVVPFAKTTLMPAALEKGDVDFTDANSTLISAAVAQGANIHMITNKQNMSFIFVTASAIQHCRDLNQKAVGFANRQSVGYVLFERHLASHCPEAKPEVVLIAESSNRVAGLVAGQLSGAYLELQEWLQLQKTHPGQFHVLVDYASEFPDTIILAVSTRREWAKQNPVIVADYLRALLTAQRAVMANPQLLADSIVKYLGTDSAQASEWANAYIQAEMWWPNGGLTQKNVEYTLSMLIDSQLVPAGLKPEDVADLSYLSAVLDEIGRK